MTTRLAFQEDHGIRYLMVPTSLAAFVLRGQQRQAEKSMGLEEAIAGAIDHWPHSDPEIQQGGKTDERPT